MTHTMITFATVKGYTVKEVTHLGKKHLVVPIVMMVEGVHSGSHGPLLHTIAELGKFAGSWNGIPIVIDHPKINGESVSANTPEIIEQKVGTVYNTKVKGKKLTAEGWLDEDMLRQTSSDVLAAVKASEQIEVSVGVFSDEKDEEGEFDGEEYDAIAINHRPDHLALLPGGTGACSIEDGCGIRSNSNNNNKKGVKHDMVRTDKLVKTFQSVKEQGYALLDLVDNTNEGLMERLEAVRRKIDSLDTNDTYHFVHEVYDEYVVYESRLRVGESKIYKQNYSFNSGIVDLTGDPVQVHKKVEYVVNNSNVKFIRTKPIKNKEDKMVEKNECPKCLEKINALIANKDSKFEEADREQLLTFDEATLDKLAPTVVEIEKKVEKEVEVNKLSPEDKAALAYGKKQMKARRDLMTKSIQDNASKETWPDAVLNSMDEDTLERVYISTKKEDETDFSLQGNGNGEDNLQVNEDEVKPMILGREDFKEKKEEDK